MKAALYACVSTKDKDQQTENQKLQLREICCAQGWTIVREYEDYESGGTAERIEFQTIKNRVSLIAYEYFDPTGFRVAPESLIRLEQPEVAEGLFNRRDLVAWAGILLGCVPWCGEAELFFAVRSPGALGHKAVLPHSSWICGEGSGFGSLFPHRRYAFRSRNG